MLVMHSTGPALRHHRTFYASVWAHLGFFLYATICFVLPSLERDQAQSTSDLGWPSVWVLTLYKNDFTTRVQMTLRICVLKVAIVK